MTVSLNVRANTDDAIRRLRRFRASALDGRSVLKAVGLAHLSWVDRNFRADGGMQRPKWKPLSPNTIAGRRGGSSKPLQDSGRLKQSFQVLSSDDHQIEVGTNSQIAEFHEEGTPPYVIKPRAKKMLRFTTVDGPTFAKEVNHPGLPKRKMMPTKRVAERIAQDLIDARLDKAEREFNQGA